MIICALIDSKVVQKEIADVTFDRQTQVLVVGAGSAGVFVCDSARREGAKVTLIEWTSTLGGMHVKGNVTGFYMGSNGGSYLQDEEKNLLDTAFYADVSSWEQKQIRVTERLRASGAEILLNTSVTGIYFEKNVAVGVRAFDGKNFINIQADIIVDATSDGHLIRMIWVNKRYGREFDGATAPFTIRRQYLDGENYVTDNSDCGHINQYDEFDFSDKIINARANAQILVKDKKFINHACYTGVREGLTFDGEDTLTYKDFLLRKETDRTLFYAYSDLDRHGYDRAIDEEEFQNWWVVSNLSTVAVNVPVPMGAVVPKGIKGLITAGRCLSADSYSQSAVRMNKDMFRMGECIGVAVAMAVKARVDFLNIDYDRYLERVNSLGCFMGKTDRLYAFQTTKAWYDNKIKTANKIPDKKHESLPPNAEIYFPIGFDLQKNYHLLKTDEPGVALWSCYIHNKREALASHLYNEMLSTADRLYKYNLAIALGLLGDRRSLKTLKEIVENRDCFYFKDNRRSNQFRSVVAVCLLGRLGGVEELSLLDGILSSNEFENTMYHTLAPNYLYHIQNDRNFLYFQMITHTVVAYVKICKRNGLDNYKKILSSDRVDGYVRNILSETTTEQAKEEVDSFFKNVWEIQ